MYIFNYFLLRRLLISYAFHALVVSFYITFLSTICFCTLTYFKYISRCHYRSIFLDCALSPVPTFSLLRISITIYPFKLYFLFVITQHNQNFVDFYKKKKEKIGYNWLYFSHVRSKTFLDNC